MGRGQIPGIQSSDVFGCFSFTYIFTVLFSWLSSLLTALSHISLLRFLQILHFYLLQHKNIQLHSHTRVQPYLS